MVLLRPQEITATTGRWLLIRRWLLLLSLLTIVIVLHVQSRRRADAITSAQNASNSSAQQKEADEEAEDSRDRLKRDIVVNPGPKAPIAPSNTKLTDVEYAPGQQLVKRMMRTAWRAYYQYARDFDELAPLSKTGTNFYGRDTLKLTAIDSLDTLLIMGLQEEFQQAKQLVLDVSFDRDMNISVFESNIRIVGGLLSVFALTGDGQYVSKAFDLANRYRSVFSPLDVSAPNWTFPLREVDLVGHFKVMDAPTRPQQDVVILAEVGTLTLELAYLAHITKDRTLVKKAEDAIQRLSEMTSPYPGLLPRLIQTKATHQTGYFGVGGMADSYYEYLLKYYVQTGNLMHKRLLEQALDGIQKYLVKETNGQLFIIGRDNEREDLMQEHLSCFIGGFLALCGHYLQEAKYTTLGAALTESCYDMYRRQPVMALSPEKVSVPDMQPVRGERHYIQRPEVVESLYLMYKVTGDAKYREWGLSIANSIVKYCRTSPDLHDDDSHQHDASEDAKKKVEGFFSYYDVTDPNARKDKQESFFMAETLKYLYLLFTDRQFLPLDKWVFNTEAHPLPIIQNVRDEEGDIDA